MSDETIDPELVAEIEASIPDIFVPEDASSLWWFEMAHAAMDVLGLRSQLHDQHCQNPTDVSDFVVVAASAERLLDAVQHWLKDHGVPRLHFCFFSQSCSAPYFATILGVEAVRFREDGTEEPS